MVARVGHPDGTGRVHCEPLRPGQLTGAVPEAAPFGHEVAGCVELLDPVVVAVGHEHVAAGVERHGVRVVELAVVVGGVHQSRGIRRARSDW